MHKRPGRLTTVAIMVLVSLGVSHVARPEPRADRGAVTAFYTTTEADTNHKAGWPPPKVASFPAGATSVGYYVAYSGVKPLATRILVIEHDPDGGIVTGTIHTLQYVAGTYTDYFMNTQPAYSPGTYTFDLFLNGALARQVRFSISPGIVLPSLYTTTGSAMDTWMNNTNRPNPKKTTAFPGSTSTFGYFVGFVGITPKITTIRATLYDSQGNVVVQGNPHTLHHVAGYFGNEFYDHSAFPDGTYHMTVVATGGTHISTTFTVG